jgi:hypothetical protein
VTLEDNTVVSVQDLLDQDIKELPEAEQQAMQGDFCWHILRNKINVLLSEQQARPHHMPLLLTLAMLLAGVILPCCSTWTAASIVQRCCCCALLPVLQT